LAVGAALPLAIVAGEAFFARWRRRRAIGSRGAGGTLGGTALRATGSLPLEAVLSPARGVLDSGGAGT